MPNNAHQTAEIIHNSDPKPFELMPVGTTFIVQDKQMQKPNITWFLDLCVYLNTCITTNNSLLVYISSELTL